MMQNVRVTAFTVSDILRKSWGEGGINLPIHPDKR